MDTIACLIYFSLLLHFQFFIFFKDLISEAIDVIVQQQIETFDDIFELKAALWAVVTQIFYC